jgi:Fe-S-cluster-containing hydrogenase component 2
MSPMGLNPSVIAAIEKGKLKRPGVLMDCFECGSCSFICPQQAYGPVRKMGQRELARKRRNGFNSTRIFSLKGVYGHTGHSAKRRWQKPGLRHRSAAYRSGETVER